MDMQKLICTKDSTIRSVMMCIEGNAKKTAFIVDEDDVLVGVVTDGDIRRLLLDGEGLNEKIGDHINPEFVFSYIDDVPQEKLAKFHEWINIVPLVDRQMHIKDYIEYSEKLHVALAQPQMSGNEYKYLMDAFLSTWISSSGQYIKRFEEDFARYCGVAYGVSTSNGTTALHLALTALGIGPGDEVIVPDLTFAATINSVLYTGATPVIVDIEKESWCIDPEQIEQAVTPRTKAVIPVHLYGQPCDMGRICEIAQRHGLWIVEDCAEAHGAEWNGKKVGSFGIISCFSFFGNKVVTTGEGGMCVTDSKELEAKMRVLRDHGMSKDRKYYHEVIGFNYRMTNLQAAIGVAQVERIDSILQWRSDLEEKYYQALSRIRGVELQKRNLPGRKKIAWLVSVLVDEDKRDRLVTAMKSNEIDVRNFFIPLSEMEIYRSYGKNCVNSRELSRRGINLPTTIDITDRIIESIGSIFMSVTGGQVQEE